jgi:hypothetical protein
LFSAFCGSISFHPQAKKDLAAFFEALSQEERDVILDPKGTMKLPTKDTNKVLAVSVSPVKATDTEPTQPSKKQQKQKAEDAENDMVCTYSYPELCLAHQISSIDQSEATTSKSVRPKKETDPEKAAKVCCFVDALLTITHLRAL